MREFRHILTQILIFAGSQGMYFGTGCGCLVKKYPVFWRAGGKLRQVINCKDKQRLSGVKLFLSPCVIRLLSEVSGLLIPAGNDSGSRIDPWAEDLSPSALLAPAADRRRLPLPAVLACCALVRVRMDPEEGTCSRLPGSDLVLWIQTCCLSLT